MRIPPLCSLIVEVMRLDEERERGVLLKWNVAEDSKKHASKRGSCCPGARIMNRKRVKWQLQHTPKWVNGSVVVQAKMCFFFFLF